MARSFVASLLLTAAKQRADMENSSFVSDTEWYSYISASYTRLYNRLVKSGIGYFESTDSISATGASTYALPADYLGTIRVDFQEANGHFRPLRRASVGEKHRFETNTGQEAVVYRISGSNLELLPAPSTGTYRHTYIPAADDITSGLDSVDGVSGFEEIIILDAAIKAKQKEESPTKDLVRERDILLGEIEEMAQMREWGEPATIYDSDLDDAYMLGDFYPRRGVR